jgi:hypothetical protein
MGFGAELGLGSAFRGQPGAPGTPRRKPREEVERREHDRPGAVLPVPAQAVDDASKLWHDWRRFESVRARAGLESVLPPTTAAPSSDVRLSAGVQLDDLFWTTPSLAVNTLLLRGVEHLYCVRK